MADAIYSDDEAVVIPFAPDYSITPAGVVTRIVVNKRGHRPRELKGSLAKNGYRMVCLTIDGEEKHFLLHRLIALVFLGNPPADKPLACHNDGDKTHNHLRNIRWDDSYGNMADKIVHGTLQSRGRNGNAVLTDEAIAHIRATPYRYGVLAQLARQYGVTKSTISKVRLGQSWN